MGYSIFDDTMVDMTWPEIERAIQQKAIVLFPLGVIEEHGPHLGLAVDIYVSYLLARIIKAKLASRKILALIAPPYYWGINTLTGAFPGSFDVRPETLKAVLRDTFDCLKKWGIKDIFTLNAHGEHGHNAAIVEAVKEAYSDPELRAYCFYDESEARSYKLRGKEKYVIIKKSEPQPAPSSPYLDLHAGSLETGIMVNYFPKQAKAELARSLEPSKITFADLKVARQGGETARQILSAGYMGNPAGFDPEVAQHYIETEAQDYAELIEKKLRETSLGHSSEE